MTITNKEFYHILTLVIGELVYLEKQGKENTQYYKDIMEIKRKLMIINNVKKG